MNPVIEYCHGETCIRFWCEGCKAYHVVPVSDPKAWNGSLTRPTFSNLITVHGPGETRCQAAISFGIAHYTLDSTHALAGRLVPLDLP